MERTDSTQGISKERQNRTELETINIRRNPYLAEYGEHRKPRRSIGAGSGRSTATKSAVGVVESGRSLATKSTSGAARRRRQIEKRRQARMRRMLIEGTCGLIMCVLLFCAFVGSKQKEGNVSPVGNAEMDAVEQPLDETVQGLSVEEYAKHPAWTEDFLTPNEYSRPGDALTKVNSIFVHYTANPGTSAAQNRSYFEQQKDTHERSVSSHFIIGYDGEIIQCVPLDEIAYAVQTRNEDSISIECCYLAEDGSFTQETYDSLIMLLRWLVEVYALDVEEDILRHYDCGGKKCPIYYVENEDAWRKLKENVLN